jgi:glutamate/tyrosine decarboxylase-like PLP-dependent enzyme
LPESKSGPLAPSPEEIRQMGAAAVEFVASYYEGLRAQPLLKPSSSAQLRELLEGPVPQAGAAFDELLEIIRGVIVEYSRHNAHPRFFGYVSSPGAPVASIGSMIASALNINLTSWRSAPAAAEMERLTINWLKEMLGYPSSGTGLLVSGGSMANFAGLAAARSAKSTGNVTRDGVGGGPKLCAYVSAEGHFSVKKAAGMLGLGEASVRAIRTDERMRIDLAALEQAVAQDLAAGHRPFCVVASAGTTATGAIDPIAALAAFAHIRDMWLHVDAAYGGFAALAPAVRPLFAGLDRADSVALDPHKWLFLPVGCGCVLYKDPAAARAAFSHDADYTRPVGLENDEAFAFWDYGPELSRPFRALDLWLVIRSAGLAGLRASVESNLACAKYLEKLVNESDDFEMLAPVELSIFCFRHKPRGFTGDLDAWNEQLMVKLQRGGSSYLSNATVGGKFALRGCVLNYRSEPRDMEILLEDLRRAAAE